MAQGTVSLNDKGAFVLNPGTDTDAHTKFVNALVNWNTLSSTGTVTGEFFKVFNQLGEISTSISKILGTVENTIKIMGL